MEEVKTHWSNLDIIDIEGEIWKDIPNFISLYQASNLGRIKALSKSVKWNGSKRTKITVDMIMCQCDDKDGYKILTLSKNKKRISCRVHRLVLMAFIGMPTLDKPMCMHLDDNPANNCIENLMWGNNSENEKQAYFKGRKVAPRIYGITGSKHPSSKKVIQLDNDGSLIKLHLSVSEAGLYCNIKAHNISACLIKRQNTAGGYKWAYA